jgi:hypothetical protein
VEQLILGHAYNEYLILATKPGMTHGEPTSTSLVVKTWRQTGRIPLQVMIISPLHQDLIKMAGKKVLTGEARGAVEIDGGERNKWLPRGWKQFVLVFQLHKREGNMRRRMEHLAGDERWRNQLSPMVAVGAPVIQCGGRRGWLMIAIPRAKHLQGLED